jgi:hypothetical protein
VPAPQCGVCLRAPALHSLASPFVPISLPHTFSSPLLGKLHCCSNAPSHLEIQLYQEAPSTARTAPAPSGPSPSSPVPLSNLKTFGNVRRPAQSHSTRAGTRSSLPDRSLLHAMQSSMQTFKAMTAPRGVAARAGRRAAAPMIVCQHSMIKDVAKAAGAAALAVSLVLVSGRCC